MQEYPHTISVTRTVVTASTTGGVPVDGTSSTVYSGECDAQENSKRFDVASGVVSSKGSATVYVPSGIVQGKAITTGDSVVITWCPGQTTSGRIESTDRLEDSFVVRYS